MRKSLSRRAAYWLAACAVLIMWLGLTPVRAQADAPWNAATTIRQALFAAQTALPGGDANKAIDSVKAASSIYEQSLKETILAAAPEVAASLDDALNAALAAVRQGDSLGLAAARSRVWTGLLHGSARVVIQAIEQGDLTTAQRWLQLRDFRTPTRFSRPGADSTLALKALAADRKSTADSLMAVRADLLDTYQAKLNEALANADNARQQGFDAKEAEQAALAAGYFDLLTDTTLSDAYLKLRGVDGLSAGRAAFAAFVDVALGNQPAAYPTARAGIDAALKGFRAAPLSEAELARRAGQLAQFVNLVAVEYARGVANGKIINDLEIQEALTFREGASAAFADLKTALEARDPGLTAQTERLLADLKSQVLGTVDPGTVQGTVNKVGGLLTTLFPASWQRLNSGSDFDVIGSVLDQIEPAVQQGLYAQAENARLEAYAILDSGIEQKLRGFAPDLAVRVESLFWQGDGQQTGLAVLLTSSAPLAEVKAGVAAVRTALNDAQSFLGSARTAPAAIAGNAAVIVFREGLEAVLILASLVASMRSAESKGLRSAIFMGAALAFVAAGLTWWIANGLLMSMLKYGEKLSVLVGVIAIAVLLLITNWFFHKTYWVGWMANFHKQKRRILGGTLVIGPSLGLVVLGFTSIYREGFETVLFLQSLVLDSGLLPVLQGAALGLLGTALVGLVVFVLQVRLPAKRLLIVTGILIGVVLLTMVGNTVHAAQSVGWLPITPIAGLYLPYWMGQWFGLYATWQGIGLQILAGVFVIGSYFLAERLKQRQRVTASRHDQAMPAEPLSTASNIQS